MVAQPKGVTLSYLCNACGKIFGPLTTRPVDGYVELSANCMKCKKMYTTKAEIVNSEIVLVDKNCKKCKSDLEVFQGKCPSCGSIGMIPKF